MTLLGDLCQKIVPNLVEEIDKYKREKWNLKTDASGFFCAT